MQSLADTRARITTLSPEQREQFRREGRIARAVEAAQRRTGVRLARTAAKRARTTLKH